MRRGRRWTVREIALRHMYVGVHALPHWDSVLRLPANAQPERDGRENTPRIDIL